MTRPEAHNGAVFDKKRLKTIEAPVEASSVNRLETTEGKKGGQGRGDGSKGTKR